jgi:uncharacterized membrane protein
MIFNGSSKIKDDGGDYLVLTDYDMEGFSVSHQDTTIESALKWIASCGYTSPMTLVKLVRIEMKETGDKSPVLMRGEPT